MEERIPAAFEFHYVPLDSWWENRFNPIPEGLAVFATDITERKRAEAERQRAENETRRSQEQLRALSAHLQTVREEERTHIAREIHDELGQVLTRLKMELSLLEESWHVRKDRDPVPSDEQALRRMVTLVDGSIQTVRKIATELRPTMLDTLGLSAAIEWQAQEFLETSGISCAVSLPDDEWTVDREISTALFRILQESLTNVVRHARARNVSVALWNDGHATTLEVEDDGVGISPELIGGPKFFGLLSMKERALVLGGTLDVTRGQDGGTKIVARIPHVAEAARTHLP
jgi:signal transduction histidine kinase